MTKEEGNMPTEPTAPTAPTAPVSETAVITATEHMPESKVVMLTADKVKEVLSKCFFTKAEVEAGITQALPAPGIRMMVGFHPGRIEENQGVIKALLDQLPDTFQEKKGGGMSFLNACEDKHGTQWGEHVNIDELMMLGLAAGWLTIPLPRAMWRAFRGGMPYLVVMENRVKIEAIDPRVPVPRPAPLPRTPSEVSDETLKAAVPSDEAPATDPAPAAEEQAAPAAEPAPDKG